jgi:hypothetical protein
MLGPPSAGGPVHRPWRMGPATSAGGSTSEEHQGVTGAIQRDNQLANCSVRSNSP